MWIKLFFFQSFFGLGSGGLQIKITVNGTPETHPNNIVYLRHRPSWKVRKNVFTVLKNHPNNNNIALGGSTNSNLNKNNMTTQQLQQQLGGMAQRGGNFSIAAAPNNSNRIMVYSCDHDTEGSIKLSMGQGKKLDHMGIQVKFFGRIDMVSCLVSCIWRRAR